MYQITPTCDVVGTYWTHTPKRRERVLFMTGHIDYSSSLIVRAKTTGVSPISEKLTTFLMPFSPLAWVLLALMTVLTGFVFFTVEATANRTAKGLRDSVYLSAAGMLWGGYETPTTRVAIPFQIVVSFIMLIVVSACMRARLRAGSRVRHYPPLRILCSHLNFVDTANLAAALTVSAQTNEPSSLDEMRAVRPEVCIRENDVMRPLYNALFPWLRQVEYPDVDPLNAAGDFTVDRLKSDLKVQLAAKTCHAILAPTITYRFWAAQDSWVSCNTRIVEKPIIARAGYVTNLQSWCVARAFDIAIERLRLKGTIDDYANEWYPPQPCETSYMFSSRRQLATTSKGGAVGGAVATDGGTAYGQVRGILSVDRMDAVDFLGVFVLWGVATMFTLIAASYKICRKKIRTRKSIQQATAIGHNRVAELEFSPTTNVTPAAKPPAVDSLSLPHANGASTVTTGQTTFDALQASQRDAQQLISTLQDTIANVHKIQSHMLAQSMPPATIITGE